MRKLLILAIVVLVAMLCGWVTFKYSPGQTTFTIETEKFSDDAERALEKGKTLLQKHEPTVGDSTSP